MPNNLLRFDVVINKVRRNVGDNVNVEWTDPDWLWIVAGSTQLNDVHPSVDLEVMLEVANSSHAFVILASNHARSNRNIAAPRLESGVGWAHFVESSSDKGFSNKACPGNFAKKQRLEN